MPRPDKYQRHIDGLRAVAILCVVFFHYGQATFSGGFVGVDVFFVISGYLISSLIISEISDTGNFDFKRFYIRRLRRLFPALLVTLVASLIFSVTLFSPEQLHNYGRTLTAAVFSVSNIQFWLDSGYFDNGSHSKPLLHTWSLSVEEQFYLLWPALLWFFARGHGRQRQLVILIILGCLSFGLNYLWVHSQFDPKFRATLFYLTPFRIFELALGALAIFLPQIISRRRWVHEVLMAAGLLMIAYAALNYSSETVFPNTAALLPCVGALLVIVSPGSTIVGALLNNRLAVGIGLISYSLYLIHWPALVFYEYYTSLPLSQTEYFALFTLSIVLSVLMYHLIEKPFRRNSPTRQLAYPQKLFVGCCIAICFLLGFTGFLIGQSDGKLWTNSKGLSANEIRQASQKRNELVRSGCSLLKLEKKQYCRREKSKQILIIGNSHEPDGFNIFSQVYRSNPNVNLIAFGSLNSCDVSVETGLPVSKERHRRCDERTAMLADKSFIDSLDGIVLSANKPFGENQRSAWKILTLIQKTHPEIPLVVVGGYINTTRKCSDLYHRFGSFTACKDPLQISYNPFNERESSEVEGSSSLNYLYIDKTKLLCRSQTLESCIVVVNNKPAFYDWHHLSMDFSLYLGKRVAQEYGKELRLWGFPAVMKPKPQIRSGQAGQMRQ